MTIKRVAARRLSRFAAKTVSRVDDVLAEMVARTSLLFPLAISIFVVLFGSRTPISLSTSRSRVSSHVALTGLSFATSRLELGAWAAFVALTIAAVKASIVLIVFMHLYRAPFTLRFVAALNIIWVALLCAGIAADVAAR